MCDLHKTRSVVRQGGPVHDHRTVNSSATHSIEGIEYCELAEQDKRERDQGELTKLLKKQQRGGINSNANGAFKRKKSVICFC